MPDPAITTVTPTSYTATATKSLIADTSVNVTAAGREFHITYPDAAADVQLTLTHGGVSLAVPLPVPAAGFTDSATYANRSITVFADPPSGGNILLTCTLQVTAGGSATEAWTFALSGTAPHDYAIDGNATFTRVMCDPIARFTVSSTPALATANHVPEKSSVLLTAANAGAPGQTVVGAPVPAVSYRFRHTAGDVAIPALPVCGPSTTFTFTAPGVYGNRTAEATLDVWFDGSCPSTPGPLSNTSTPVTITVEPRPQRLVMALDRSGSMNAGGRWTNAETSARLLVNLFAALRAGVHPGDRVGILVFEDSQCRFHGGARDPLIALAGGGLAPPSTADGAICAQDLGHPGTCTPIGDALTVAQEQLGSEPGTRHTIVLLTDGYENSGTTRVSPNTPVGNGSVPAQWVQPSTTDFPIYAIGFGPTVQEDVLDHIALPGGSSAPAVYRHVTDVGDLKQAIADMVAASQEAQQTPVLPGGPTTPDPAPVANARYLQVAAGTHRLAVAVEWSNPADTLQVAWRAVGSSDFTTQALPVRQCPRHGFVSADLETIVPEDPATGTTPATEWRIAHVSGGANVAIPDGDILAYEDLFAKFDIQFDSDRYLTGDEMVITARLRAGAEPITDARVLVEMARPGESLGTFLATNGRGYKPGRGKGPDPPSPKQAMLESLTEGEGLPIVTPTGIFSDGTDELFDDGAHRDGDAGDGDFANVFAATDAEGSYTFRFFLDGRLRDGSPIRRVTTVSRWVGVGVDALASTPRVQTLAAGRGLGAAIVSVRPRDAAGNFLGPFRAAEVKFHVRDGRAVGEVQDHLDGVYSQRIEYTSGKTPVVTVDAAGSTSLPVPVASGLRGWLVRLLECLLRKLLRKKKS